MYIMNEWTINKTYEVGDIITVPTQCGIKHYKAIIKHKSSPVPSGLKSDLDKYWTEIKAPVGNTVPTAVPPCNRNEDLAEKTLIMTAGIFVGLILSKIVS